MFKPEYTSRYYIEKILDAEEIFHLQKLYDEKTRVDSSLKNESYYGIVNRSSFKKKDETINSILQKLNLHAIQYNEKLGKDTDLFLKTMYFQEYLKDSHLPEHVDSISKNGVTLVTLINKSPDLLGGDILIIDNMKIYKKEHNRQDINSDPNTKIRDMDSARVHVCMPQSIGETAVYVNGTVHSITKVLRGSRLVLVSWFDTKQSS